MNFTKISSHIDLKEKFRIWGNFVSWKELDEKVTLSPLSYLSSEWNLFWLPGNITVIRRLKKIMDKMGT